MIFAPKFLYHTIRDKSHHFTSVPYFSLDNFSKQYKCMATKAHLHCDKNKILLQGQVYYLTFYTKGSLEPVLLHYASMAMTDVQEELRKPRMK